MRIQRVDLSGAGSELDTVIVIDVIRAYTTTAFAFKAGASKIILVSDVDEAFTLKERFPDAILMGEVNGYPIEGFDFGNSPSALLGKDLSGRLLVHRTSAGTQGAVMSAAAKSIYVTGLCNARATAERVRELLPGSLTLIETGIREGGWGEEDIACADYICGYLTDGTLDPKGIVQRVSETKSAKLFSKESGPELPEDDLKLVLDIDRFDFVMTIQKSGGLLYLVKE